MWYTSCQNNFKYVKGIFMEINKLKEKIEVLAENIPDGMMIHLKKDVLEKLLFTEVIYNKATGDMLKLPTWSGKFLRKIDLSEVSFEDVAWSLLVPSYDDVRNDLLDKDIFDRLMSDYYAPHDYVVDYSMTNANIDFSTSFEAKNNGFIDIVNCDFSCCDLSKNDMTKFRYASDSKFNFSNLILPDSDFNMYYCDLRGLNLSKFTEDAYGLISDDTKARFKNCDLRSTNISVLSSDDLYGVRKDNFDSQFNEYLNNGCLDYCRLDGNIVKVKKLS